MSISMNLHPINERFVPTIDADGEGEGCCLNICLHDPNNSHMFHAHAGSNKALNEFILRFKEAANNLQLIEEKGKEEE